MSWLSFHYYPDFDLNTMYLWLDHLADRRLEKERRRKEAELRGKQHLRRAMWQRAEARSSTAAKQSFSGRWRQSLSTNGHKAAAYARKRKQVVRSHRRKIKCH